MCLLENINGKGMYTSNVQMAKDITLACFIAYVNRAVFQSDVFVLVKNIAENFIFIHVCNV